VAYEQRLHEVDRNLQLLRPLGITPDGKESPHLFPSSEDRLVVDRFLALNKISDSQQLIGIAPGTVWNTKRWHIEGFIKLSQRLAADGFHIVLIGGPEDAARCRDICSNVGARGVTSSAGFFTLLQSAEMIRRCRLLVSNDSAPMHLAVGMQTPVVAIFGATIPEFGFAPYGRYDVVIETNGLPCRPCSIHGGDRCPITTFDCMVRISAEDVYTKIHELITKLQHTEG
jgi:heptosyltransferase-2